jgi:hypothetical protein
MIPFACILIPVMWAVGVVLTQSNIAIVAEDLGIFAGLERGWDVFKKNFGPLIVMFLILGVGSAVIGFIISLPLVLVLAPVAIMFITGNESAILATLLISAVLLVIFGLIFMVINGVLQSYVMTAWTLTYRRLTAKPIELESIAPSTPDILPGVSE